jgi:HEAT repeat protein
MTVPALIATLNDPDMLVRVGAFRTLLQTEGHIKATEAALIKLLDDKDALIRCLAVDSLSLLVPASKEVVQALVRTALTDSDLEIRANAAAALGQDCGLP